MSILLPLVIATPILGIILILLAGRVNDTTARMASAVTAGLGLVASLVVFGMVQTHGIISLQAPWIPQIGSTLHLVADGVSGPLVLLTGALLLVAVLVANGEVTERVPMFHACLHAATAGIMVVFLARDAFLFYFGYELMLIPMFLIIGKWGHENRSFAAIRFLLFTFGGSIFLLASILYLHAEHLRFEGVRSFGIDDLARTAARLPFETQWWVYLGILIGFGVKIPLFPLHTWLPETYTQSPTAGNILLAGVMSKTGLYGLLRLAEPLAPSAALAWTPYVLLFAVISVFLAAWAAFAQRDIKRVIAYSSISHLGIAVVGVVLAAGSESAGLKGAIMIMVAHGLSTAGLFLVAGLVHRHARTRELAAYGGLWAQAPVLGGFMLFFTVATLGLPGTANFVGEIYVIAESFRQNPSLGILLAVAVVFAAAYSLRLFLLTMHGPSAGRVRNLPDATSSDITVLASLTTAIIIFGFAPAAVVPARVIVAEVESVKMTPAQRPRIPSTPSLSVRQTILPRQSPKDDATTSTQPTMEATR